MKPLEQIDLMSKETDSKTVRDAVKQLSFAYKRSAKARQELISDGPETSEADMVVSETVSTKVTASQMVSSAAEPYDELMIEAFCRRISSQPPF